MSLYNALVTRATRKFESLEHSIARRLIRLSESKKVTKNEKNSGEGESDKSKKNGTTREQIMRGVKIGSVGVVAGTLFALTGGLAAVRV